VAARGGDATREHLLDVAEQLLGERGVFNVSLREIRIAAGAGNTAAVQHYFGDRDGLIDALAARHISRIGGRQRTLWEEIVAEGQQRNPRRLVELLVRPCAEYLELGPSERAWIKIMAELASLPDLRMDEMVTFTPTAGVAAGRALHEMMTAHLPERIARERMFICTRMVVRVCSDRARLIDDPTEKDRQLPPDVFSENLVDMLSGALLAPAAR
jgi:AcrR family transcriptional regulator